MNICDEYLPNPPLGLKVESFLRAVWRCAAGVQCTEIAGLCELLRPAQLQRRLQRLMVGPGRSPVLQDMQSGRTGGSRGCPGPLNTQAGSMGKTLWRGWWHGVWQRVIIYLWYNYLSSKDWMSLGSSVGIYSRLWVGVRGHWEVAVSEKSNSTVHNVERNNLKENIDILVKH